MDFQHKFNEVTLMFSTRYLTECESFGRELFYDSMNSVAKDENSYEYSRCYLSCFRWTCSVIHMCSYGCAHSSTRFYRCSFQFYWFQWVCWFIDLFMPQNFRVSKHKTRREQIKNKIAIWGKNDVPSLYIVCKLIDNPIHL